MSEHVEILKMKRWITFIRMYFLIWLNFEMATKKNLIQRRIAF